MSLWDREFSLFVFGSTDMSTPLGPGFLYYVWECNSDVYLGVLFVFNVFVVPSTSETHPNSSFL